MMKQLETLSAEDFDEIKDSVLTIFEEKDKNLKEQFDRFWTHEFSTHKYDFDRQEKECAMIEELSQEEFTAHFKSMFGPEARRLDICMHSSKHISEKPEGLWSAQEFKSTCSFYLDAFKQNFVEANH